ncbi:WD repeat-containing protein on Y chromosome isoform X1 [Astyanax mexicanus]|uniref:WD repeat-containing protein on Y chromosome isoform X1 n=2 Tax=Astyanax mexicanus TaxID=7994 RepID=UPI0020CB0AC8|nr:WD repeat-containing protein on Y chromosome isoform X1 [Astyanax mexicanus]
MASAHQQQKPGISVQQELSELSDEERGLLQSAAGMPLGKNARPSSAQGRIQTQNVSSVLTETGPGPGAPGPVLIKQTGSELQEKRSEKSVNPDWLERALLKQEYRRHSLPLGDATKLITQQRSIRNPASSLSKLKIEQRVSLENLTKLKLAFEDYEKAGTRSLDLPRFRQTIRRCLGLRDITDAQIRELFMKIDYSGQGSVEWDEFCTYMQLEYTEKEELVVRSKQVAFALPATMKPLSHGEPILKIHQISDGMIVTLKEDGAVSYWSSTLQLRKSKSVFHERPIGRKAKWATDLVTMPQYNKLIIGTGDREIQLYELSSLEPHCQINSLETVPLKLDYCYTGPDECAVVYGDAQGCVSIILMTSVGETLRLWKKLPKVENVPSISIDHAVQSPNITYIRWKVHEDWVTKVKYFQSIPAVVSTSNHEASALVIGCILPSTNIEQQMREIKEACREGKGKKAGFGVSSPQQRVACDQTVFSIYKGVKTFDFCTTRNLLITGGMDRLIRMWNPYVPGSPTGILKGHSALIFYLHIATEDGRVFSVSTDNSARIWDIQDQSCLFAAHPKASFLRGELTACLYSPAVKGLYISTDSLALLSLKTKAEPQGSYTTSHKEAVLCCGYSAGFRQVVSCSEGSVIKVWDVDTGNEMFEFGGAHGLSAVTCMTFDPKGRRLVTGGRDGCLRIWNFNNGHCLKTLSREDGAPEICDCCYLQVHRNTFVMSVGWARRIDVYLDSAEDTRHVQRPKPAWEDDLMKGHREDVLCVAQCPPYLLATGSYDGEIIMWNLVSGRIQSRFLTPPPPNAEDPQTVDRSVLSLVFLRTRAIDAAFSSAASLLSSGAQGQVHFWNVQNGGKFVQSFNASRLQQQIRKLAVTADDRLLFAGDDVGYVCVYDIQHCALALRQDPPPTVNFWRAHISSITGLHLIESEQVLLTSSTDCTVRLWSITGEFIGTFGQRERWSLHTASSWKHPAVPYEVLIDPLSLPSHCRLDGKIQTLSDVLSSESTEDTESDSPNKVRNRLPSSSDREMEEINSAFYPQHRKWRRHEIFKHANKSPDHAGPKLYHALKCYDVDDVPAACEELDLTLAGIDAFTASSEREEPAGI